jgi:electron transfer flavoprotein-quinone oxidoreductase
MEKFEVIIVGAGLAGLAAAYTLAESGVEVLLLERGDYPGAKNVSGGRLYVNPIRSLFPGLFEDAPFERFIVQEGISLLAKKRSVSLQYSDDELRNEPHQSYSVLRSKFDRWLADKVEGAGAMLLSKVKVESLVREKGKIAGVIAGGDELRADAVIACDGVLSLISEMAGLRMKPDPHHYALGIKEIIMLDEKKIDDRFQLRSGEGAARLYAGEVTKARFGGGFLYTNRDSISLGVVIGIEELLKDRSLEATVLMDDFKERPEISSLIKEGETVEYSAHLIPEGGYKAMGELCGDGILVAGDAAGFALNIGFTVRGMEYALASGYYAARAFLKAKEAGDFSRAGFSVYRRLLDESFVMKDMKSFQDAPHVIENPRFFGHYPEMFASMMKDIYAVPEGQKGKLYPTIKKYLTLAEVWSIFKDLREAMKI